MSERQIAVRVLPFSCVETMSGVAFEPLFQEDRSRFCLMPIRHPSAYKRYKKARESNWEVGEVDFSKDKIDIAKVLTPAERKTVLTVIAFFQVADGVVAENIVANFYKKIVIPELRLFYGVQLAQEGVHAEMYGLTIEALVDSIQEREELLDSISLIPAIQHKTEWGVRWMENGTVGEQLFAFGIFEGVFFSSSFCIIFWLKKRGLMPGLTYSNEFISREEKEHCDFESEEVWPLLVDKPSEERLQLIMREAVECEKEFVHTALPEALVGMNSTLMCQYVEFVADRVLMAHGVRPIYNAKLPFEWMNLMGIPGRASFFEKKVADYVTRGVAPPEMKIEYDEEGF